MPAPRALQARRTLRALALVLGLALLGSGTANFTLARFSDSRTSTATLSTDTLSPPTGLSATDGLTIGLSWTASPKTWATGYHVYRATASAGPWSLVATETPRTDVSAVDSPPNGTYWYVVRAFYQGWESVDAGPVSATVGPPDATPPTIGTSVISKTGQYLPGSIRPSAGFYVYANVTDAGSGVATVTANVSSIKAGSSAVALTAGSYSVGGVSYGWRSAAHTADAKPVGTYTYTISAEDNAGNSVTSPPFSVIVETTAPTASDVQTSNGGTVGRPDAGDTIVFSYSERIDPDSVLNGWTGGTTAVTVRIANSISNDVVTIWNAGNTAQLALGSIATGGNYTSAASTFAGTMVQSGSTITVTLGTLGSGNPKTNGSAAAMTWTPSASATDAAGNACSTSPRTETGASDVDF